MKSDRFILTWLTLFSIAMGLLETAVVIYLRELYYPSGFRFPLVEIPHRIAAVECWREAATILMLVGAGMLAGKTPAQRFAYFLFAFAVWDIFYYVFLYVFLGWPESPLTWDILFLLPVPWVGPVLAPCLVGLTMIVYTLLVVSAQRKGRSGVVDRFERLLLIAGAVIILVSFMWDYFAYVGAHPSAGMWTMYSDQSMFSEIKQYVPRWYNWPLFMAGEALMLAALGRFAQRMHFSKTTVAVS